MSPLQSRVDSITNHQIIYVILRSLPNDTATFVSKCRAWQTVTMYLISSLGQKSLYHIHVWIFSPIGWHWSDKWISIIIKWGISYNRIRISYAWFNYSTHNKAHTRTKPGLPGHFQAWNDKDSERFFLVKTYPVTILYKNANKVSSWRKSLS